MVLGWGNETFDVWTRPKLRIYIYFYTVILFCIYLATIDWLKMIHQDEVCRKDHCQDNLFWRAIANRCIWVNYQTNYLFFSHVRPDRSFLSSINQTLHLLPCRFPRVFLYLLCFSVSPIISPAWSIICKIDMLFFIASQGNFNFKSLFVCHYAARQALLVRQIFTFWHNVLMPRREIISWLRTVANITQT